MGFPSRRFESPGLCGRTDASGDFGKMVAFTGPQIGAIQISDAIGELKSVHPDGNLVRTVRAFGICFGDWSRTILLWRRSLSANPSKVTVVDSLIVARQEEPVGLPAELVLVVQIGNELDDHRKRDGHGNNPERSARPTQASMIGPGDVTATRASMRPAISAAAAIFLILQLDRPLSGVLRISNEPMINV
jgi:hypothetical protein